jgi:cytochrome c556
MRSIPLLSVLPLLALSLTSCNGQPDTPEGRIAHQRHENFERIGDAYKAIGDELKKASPDIVAIRTGAGTIDGFAPKVATWFPKGTGPDDGVRTDALQTVWTKPEQFQQAASRFVSEAARFKALSQAGDLAAIRKGAAELGAACKNCHDTFREKD